MELSQYLDMFVVGQKEIKKQLAFTIPQVIRGENLNILLRGPSGCGKTNLATILAFYVNETYAYSIATDGMRFFPEYRVQVVDEMHLMKIPEAIYPIMDSKSFFFIFCTNEYNELKEPLVNRCLEFTFRDYSDDDLILMAKRYFHKNRFVLPEEFFPVIVEYSRGFPRAVVDNLCLKLKFYFITNPIPRSVNELTEILENSLDCHSGGFDSLDLAYINFLKDVGRASLETLSTVLRIPKDTIRREIEPFLIKKRIIDITSKGRIYIA